MSHSALRVGFMGPIMREVQCRAIVERANGVICAVRQPGPLRDLHARTDRALLERLLVRAVSSIRGQSGVPTLPRAARDRLSGLFADNHAEAADHA